MVMRFHENTVRKSDVALMLPVLCLLVIAGISGTNVVSGAGSGSAPNQQIARGQNALQSGEVWSTSSLTGSPEVGCVQPLTSSLIDAYYSEPYCYGHDEAVLGFLSNQPGSGGNAVLNFSLPISAPSFPQGDFYIAFWVGGVVYDPSSLDNQAFMEFQFYPASPQYT
ncbi:MAG: hypothetical protein ACRECH_07840, partial [Nitrososphaerales archaeon]